MSGGEEPRATGPRVAGPRATEPPATEPEPSQRPEPESDAPPERYGPLHVERRRKEDGRQLILYSRAEDSPEDTGG